MLIAGAIWGKPEKIIFFQKDFLYIYLKLIPTVEICFNSAKCIFGFVVLVDVSTEAAEVLVLGVTVVNGHPCIAYSHQTQMPQYPLGCTLIEPTPP